jgi:peptide-methionine (R)-S-oxide reductase
MKKISLVLLSLVLWSCNSTAQDKNKEKVYPVSKTEAEWKVELDPIEYLVLREAGTERAFSSKLNKNDHKGVYACAACGTPLFKSEYKYDSGSGWPSFDREIKGNVEYSVDYNNGYALTEEHCATCGGHLGHVFDDGPSKTTGKRHCINGAALDFIPIKNE